jgi:uncharacterized membrane protein
MILMSREGNIVLIVLYVIGTLLGLWLVISHIFSKLFVQYTLRTYRIMVGLFMIIIFTLIVIYGIYWLQDYDIKAGRLILKS